MVIGGSAGSFSEIRKILTSLPANFNVPLAMCFHRLKDKRNGFVESLEVGSKIRIIEPDDKSSIEPGVGYLAPANYHMLIEPARTLALSTEVEVNFSRPSIDLTFESAGAAYHDKMLGIMLSGANSDGAQGMFSAHKRGAYSIIQDPEEAAFGTMPGAILNYFQPHKILKVEDIIEFLRFVDYE